MPLATEALDVVKSVPAELKASPDETISAEVREMCERLGIHDLVKIALRLIEKHFQPEQIHFEPMHDPEEDCEWLAIRADVRASVDEVLRRYDACKNDWIKAAPLDKLGSIAFAYNILDA